MFDGIAAQFSAKTILITDVANPIEQGDMLIRTLPGGLRVGFIVDVPGYREALGSIPAHFEVEARRAAPIDSLEPSRFWRRRRANFERLSRRQRAVLGIDREHSKWLRGFCSRLEEGAGENVYCEIDGGLDSEFRSKFDEVATQAAMALGCASNADPVEFWLFCLCLDLLQNSPDVASTEFLRSVPGGGFIVDLLGMSAAYCSRLAAMAEHRADEKLVKAAASPSLGNGSPAAPKPSSKRRGRPPKISDERKARAMEIKAQGGTNRDAAKVIYDTRYPTDRQVKDAQIILKHHASKLQRRTTE